MKQDKLKLKTEKITNKIKQDKEILVKKVKDKKQKIEDDIKLKKKEKDILPHMFDLLVVIVNRGRGQAVLNYLKSIEIPVNIVSFGYGTAPTNIANLLGLSQEKEVIFTVVNAKDSVPLLDLLDSIFLSTYTAGIAFTIPVKSATNNSLDAFLNTNTFNNGGKK